MATRSRIGYVLKDDSIVSVYHHWDGYPEWLGNILNEHYNEDEKVSELIDGGNMSSCYTNTDDETGEIVEPHVNYYGGDDEAPRHFQTLSALTDYDCGEEFLYLWFMNTWNCYAYKKTYDDDYNTVVNNSITCNHSRYRRKRRGCDKLVSQGAFNFAPFSFTIKE